MDIITMRCGGCNILVTNEWNYCPYCGRDLCVKQLCPVCGKNCKTRGTYNHIRLTEDEQHKKYLLNNNI